MKTLSKKQQEMAVKRLKADLLWGLTGKARAAQKHWMDVLERAGLPVSTQWGRSIGPRDIVELQERLADDPETLQVLEEAHRHSTAEFFLRLQPAQQQLYRDELLRKDPALYGPMFA